MVNTDEFIIRLEKILDYYNLNASSFADKIGVQRSSMSHLLSGRNKPSLDFILKVLEVFPEVDLYWILNGKGTFPKTEVLPKEHSTIITEKENSENSIHDKKNSSEDLFSEAGNIPTENKKIETTEIIKEPQNFDKHEEVDKIVFFYKNGTFKIFKP